MSADLAGRAHVVTGANRGIGYSIARTLAARGAVVALLCRTRERAEAARGRIVEETGNADVTAFAADFGIQAEIRTAAAELAARHPRIHVLINGAGVARLRRGVTPDGIEETFAVNHLGPFLLTNLLLDAVKVAAPSRIVTVASGVHYRAHMEFSDLEGARNYKVIAAYAQSKLANVLFTMELARRLADTGVVANCVHPGTVATRIWQVSPILRFAAPLLSRFLLSPDEGAAGPVHVATSQAAGAVTGRYFDQMRVARPSAAAEDSNAARRLWDVSARMTGLA